MCSTDNNGIRPALVNRKFLNSNATSHEWMFGAIAELIDNASDPDVQATQFWIDVDLKNGQACLEFTDNGNGMSTEVLHRMLSFGFSDKMELNGRLPIGRYGNGFKSGSMRLGKDALVFTKHHGTQSVGLLSQTYLEKINADTVMVPIVTWDTETMEIKYPRSDQKSSLREILMYSLFHSERELLNEFNKIGSRRGKYQGTKIIIYNLTKDDNGQLELDFRTDLKDIRISSMNQTTDTTSENKVSEYRTSLRKYVAILYMRPPMQIFIRKQKVHTIYMKKFLKLQKMAKYTPLKFTVPKPIKIRFGINPDQDEHGIMMYNRNRLIQAFRKPPMPKRGSMDSDEEYESIRKIWEQTIGVVELDCLVPNHIKQNFQDDSKYRTIESNLASKLWYYCLDLLETGEFKSVNVEMIKEKDLWVQCDEPECQKWRRLPYGTKKELLPDVWKCYMNPDTAYNRCGVSEEPEKDPEIQKSSKPKKTNRRNSEQGTFSPVTSEILSTPREERFTHPERPQVIHRSPELGPELKTLVLNLQHENPHARLNGRKRLSQAVPQSQNKRQNASSIAPDIEIIPFDKEQPEVIVLDDDDSEEQAVPGGSVETKPNTLVKVEHRHEAAQQEATNHINTQTNIPNDTVKSPFHFSSSSVKSESSAEKVPEIFRLSETLSPNTLSILKPPSSLVSLKPSQMANGKHPGEDRQVLDSAKEQIEVLRQRIAVLEEEREKLLDELSHERARAELYEKKLTQVEKILEGRR